jgi:predicted flavoprotein YhiN
VAGIDPEVRGGTLARERRHGLVQASKHLELPVAGTLGYDHAEVTAGGVSLDEIDPGTMASRRVPGLFVAGEALDLDGPIGGFSFQAAFATAELAGRAL